MTQNIYQTTLSGFKKLKDELVKRETELRSKIADTINEMRNQGDLKENDGYAMALESQYVNEERILELKEKIKTTKIVKDKRKDIVGVGDIVTLKNGKTVKYEITGEDDANPLEGKISYLSPIGKAIMGKKLNAKIIISTPAGNTEYTIEAIA
ncbi:MAG: Transcription elongation factor GreA [candidate division WS6 bacterium GW2011_GWC1_36_11]|uniref:Transcription elongation factor GreA n=2 Tax=Candidatus Dojkabacteria TaxID=74243 RepID=A0A0G0DV88_9BACT|nr:MAG: Transcription elongation factor GreA [candidate division WS6 bacterium GW2011_GWC1_36_11]KKQ10564.1 MAG: Transcription elongation factor GreA [candidate division WS6 bacterium GW2011_GWE1_36_69]KKQ11810.1 MAG: Transcription elongation factor GreA [candidate division WS6 bacterium GW2011_GWC2_36_7]HAM37638.1 transcription elongation factor GreA [Patescibacteria group bacterium]HAM96284.1 transcription elongation factor GreA [Patescibacteria group bacterium]